MRMLACLAVLTLAACGGSDAAKSTAPPPARVDHTVKEADLNTITLTPEAEARLGIVVQPVSQREMPETRLVAGEVVVPPGDSVDVTAPVAGTLASATPGAPRAGSAVRRGEPLLRLVPLLPADRDIRASAERDVAAWLAALQAAEKKHARAQQLLADGSGSRRGVEEAHAELETARAAHRAATERLALVNRNPVGDAGDLIIAAPLDGLIAQVHATPGQTVAANAKLLQVVRLTRLWVRVPVYAGDARQLDASQGADVLRLDETQDAPGLHARRVAAPPSADPAASAVDVVFELPAGGPRTLQPGERVLVRLAGRARSTALVISDAALLHDIHGGTWVYERTAPHVFARRRVEVRDTIEGLAVLARGPAAGAMVVTTGAAELYGVEFGAGK